MIVIEQIFHMHLITFSCNHMREKLSHWILLKEFYFKQPLLQKGMKTKRNHFHELVLVRLLVRLLVRIIYS